MGWWVDGGRRVLVSCLVLLLNGGKYSRGDGWL